LILQFSEVRRLNLKLAKPVLHITLSFAPGEQLLKHQLMEIAENCARDTGFEKNQYVAVHHKDTRHQHLHFGANRIGFDGKTWSDSNSYKRIEMHCRSMELKHALKQVLSPRQYLSEELREIPRHDQRRELLRKQIRLTLAMTRNYQEFRQRMKQLGYEVIKSRGIAFRDQQKVYIKGSEVGFSLSKIETLLQLKPELKIRLLQKQNQTLPKEKGLENVKQISETSVRFRESLGISTGRTIKEFDRSRSMTSEINTALSKTLETLMKPELPEQAAHNSITEEEIKRRRKQKQRQRFRPA
jgi:hypothetical protein